MEEIYPPFLDILSWLKIPNPLYKQGISRVKDIIRKKGLKHTKILFHLSTNNKGMDRRSIGGGLQHIMIVSTIFSHINKLGLFPYFCLSSSLFMNYCGLVMIAFI